MDIFIAWSGVASKLMAECLFKWLPDVIPAAEPFMSSESVRKGQRWFPEISAKLEKTNFGILCVTRENLKSQWMHFEAGAVAKSTKQASVSALLLDVTQGDLELPFSQFQHTPANKDEVLKLVLAINEALGEQRRSEERVRNAFDKFWPDLDVGIQKAKDSLVIDAKKAASPKRTELDILEGILDAQRGIITRLTQLETQLTAATTLPYYVGAASPLGQPFGLGNLGNIAAVGGGGLLNVSPADATTLSNLMGKYGLEPKAGTTIAMTSSTPQPAVTPTVTPTPAPKKKQ